MITRLLRSTIVYLFSLLVLGTFAPLGANGQAKDKPAPDANYRVLQLKYSSANELAHMLSEFFNERPVRVMADSRSNTLIISASESDFPLIRDLVERLDSEPPNKDGDKTEVNIIHLKYIPADKNLETMLKTVISAARTKAAVAMDPNRNAIVFSGDQNTLRSVTALLESLDKPVAKEQPAREMQVRVVWLASASGGKPDKDVPKPPGDLHEVVAELDKLGVREPFLISQAVVNVTSNGTFELQGTAQLGSTPCVFAIAGQIGNKPSDVPMLQISIDATSQASRVERGFGGGRDTPLCRIQTQISAPTGHPVVLGVTPTGNLTSVFVIQLLPKRTIGERKQ